MKRCKVLAMVPLLIAMLFVISGCSNKTLTNDNTANDDDTHEVSADVIETDELYNINDEKVDIRVVTDKWDGESLNATDVVIQNFIITEQADDTFLEVGEGLLYVIKDTDTNDYYFVIGSDNDYFYAVDVDTYATALNVETDLVISHLGKHSIFDIFGYMYPSAYRDDVSNEVLESVDGFEVHDHADVSDLSEERSSLNEND